MRPAVSIGVIEGFALGADGIHRGIKNESMSGLYAVFSQREHAIPEG